MSLFGIFSGKNKQSDEHRLERLLRLQAGEKSPLQVKDSQMTPEEISAEIVRLKKKLGK